MTETNGIRAEDHKEELERILEHYGLGPECLEFTDDFPNEPLKAVKCVKLLRRITFRRHISPEAKQATIAEQYKFPEELSFLEDDLMFLKHCLLKYICSIQQRWQPEYECAKWAFYHMKRV